MIECLHCGTQNYMSNNYCTNCGEKPTNGLIRCPSGTTSLDDVEVLCRNCDKYNPIKNNYCEKCGNTLNVIIEK